jgi:hypothetical protein
MQILNGGRIDELNEEDGNCCSYCENLASRFRILNGAIGNMSR